jgi:hypothetical protein
MTNVAEALKSSGLKLPSLTYRVWQWVHDHPGKSAKDISTAIKVKHSNVSSALSDMVRRKMVTREVDVAIQARWSRQAPYIYKVTQKTYLLLPAVGESLRKRKEAHEESGPLWLAEIIEAPVDTAPRAEEGPGAGAVGAPLSRIGSLSPRARQFVLGSTVQELLEVRNVLDDMLGGM